ncbi:MAG TPA: curli production assembly/transport protein CsgG [Saprospirales bacterium]|nr:curli production assembly/transport protein CsgG [Saprospirales bacterium]
MHKILTASLLTLLISGCASVPQWSNDPQDCNDKAGKYSEGYQRHLQMGLQKTMSRKYICVDVAEAVRLPSFIDLLNLPAAKEKPIVAVYDFGDKTGQRKSREGIADFSTAVTQGGTEMIIDALKTAGGGTWFRVVERQGIDNLVRERQIIRSARTEFADPKKGPQQLNPLLFAGMIIEGGIIGYDTNLLTGGRGARTLGIGFSKRYRKDVVTVSIRAVSVLTGEVLLNVQSRKTVLSYGSSGDIFRFIEQGTQLIEYEDGVGNNESVTYAVRTAIEAGVLELIYQGHDRGFWVIENGHRHPHQNDGKNDKHSIKEENNENE